MRKVPIVRVVALSGITIGLWGPVGEAVAQTSQDIRVLVAPLRTGAGVNNKFGDKVAAEVRKSLANVSGMVAFNDGDVKKALKEFKLEPQQMNLIQWRQLGGRLNVQLVMFGTAESEGRAVHVKATFVDPKSGDELAVPEFTVANDGQSQEAARRISDSLGEQVTYQKSVVFCAEYLGSNQLTDALRNCDKALEINPASTRALYLRGRTHMGAKEWEKAVTDLEKVVADNPSNTDALQSLAFTHAQLGNTERSQQLYQDYLTFQPDDAHVRLNVAFNLAQAEAYEAAKEILQEGVERDPENTALWEYLGNVALAAGAADPGTSDGGAVVADTASLRLAVRAFDKVLELKGDSIDPAILRNAIAANLEIGDLDAALGFSDRALSALRSGGVTRSADSGTEGQTPEQVRAGIHSLRADIFTRREQLARALSEMDQTLQADPAYPNAYMKRGFLKLRTGDTRGALADYRKAVSERGQDPNAIANQLFGTGYNDYFQRGRYSGAIDMFKTALEFARSPQLTNQINFFTAYGYYQWATGIDKRNEQREACQPAQQALNLFRSVSPYLGRAGGYQSGSQAQIREATDVQLFRQQQIIKAKCG